VSSLNRVLVTAGAVLAVTGAALSHPSGLAPPPPATEYGVVPDDPASPTTALPTTPRRTPSATSQRSPRSAPSAEPVRIVVPSIGAAAAVTPVGVDRSGSLMLPPPDQVGWWIGGAFPGAPRGSLVIAGHVDTADGQHGALYNLSAVPDGVKIEVTTADGTITYQVVALRTYPKQALPRSLFTRTGPHRLLLITCGGPYQHGYTRNVVAYAVRIH
jgi:Sortase domain